MNGIAIIEKTDEKTKGVFIDQETIEFAQQNARTTKRLADDKVKKDQAARIIREAEEEARKAFIKSEKAKARRRAYTVKSIATVTVFGALSGAVALAGTAGMVHPAIWIPAALFCLCAACVRFGAWFGRVAKK